MWSSSTHAESRFFLVWCWVVICSNTLAACTENRFPSCGQAKAVMTIRTLTTTRTDDSIRYWNGVTIHAESNLVNALEIWQSGGYYQHDLKMEKYLLNSMKHRIADRTRLL